MKKLINLLVLLLFVFTASAQVDRAVSDIVDAKLVTIQTKFNALINQLDTIEKVIITDRSGVFYIDTISIANNSSKLYDIALTGFSAAAKPSAILKLHISNTGGVYKIEKQALLTGWTWYGLTGGAIIAEVIKDGVAIKITGAKTPITWTYKISL